MGNKIKFATIKKDMYQTRYSSEDKDKKFIKYGNDNQFPNYLIELYNHSSIHASCINAIAEAVKGEGLITENEELLKSANKEGEKLNIIAGTIPSNPHK